jgi:imidazolonepropionase
MRDLGIVENGFVASREGTIVFVGTEGEFESGVRVMENAEWIDGRGMVALPGFVDAHTHLPFAGNREHEFRLRLEGATYAELAARGMGIQTTVLATRAAGKDELTALCLRRLDQMLLAGTTTVEAKSGYGLNHDDEIKQLEVLREIQSIHPVDIVPTFMGAHEIPPEFKSRRDDYLDFLTKTLIPEVRRRDLAEFFDVFCEEGVFSAAETRRLVEAAKASGFRIKIHADEFTTQGGAELAAETGASSAEHLISVSDRGIEDLARSGTAAILLPGVSFFLMMDKKAPARHLLDAGAVVALATDFNPGSSMVSSMLFVLRLGVYTLRMGIEEAINASTANGAYAVDRHALVGSLEPGKKMDLLLCDVEDYVSLVYRIGENPVRLVLKDGKTVVKDGRRVPGA